MKKRQVGPTSSVNEAIEKILIEKKISSKINYDVLKSLNSTNTQNDSGEAIDTGSLIQPNLKR